MGLELPDMATPKPGVFSWLLVGLMAMSFFVVAKYLAARFPIPGISDFVQAA